MVTLVIGEFCCTPKVRLQRFLFALKLNPKTLTLKLNQKFLEKYMGAPIKSVKCHVL